MAISVGTPTTGVNTGTITDSIIPFSFTVDSGTTMLVFGLVCQFQGGSGPASHFDTCNWVPAVGATQAMTKLIEFTNGTVRSVSLWALVNPNTDAGDIKIHYTNTVAPEANPHAFRVNLTGDFFSVARSKGTTQTSSTNDPSATYTVSAAAGVVFDVCMANTAATPDMGQTTIFADVNGVHFRGGASYEVHSGSNPTLSYTGSTSVVYAGAELIESFAPPPTRSFLL